jgi:hypothetical protein
MTYLDPDEPGNDNLISPHVPPWNDRYSGKLVAGGGERLYISLGRKTSHQSERVVSGNAFSGLALLAILLKGAHMAEET